MLGGAAAWENVDSTAGRAGPGRAGERAGGSGLASRPGASPRRAVPQVRAPPRVLHADPDALGRRAHDHVLQVLQRAVRAPLAGLSRPALPFPGGAALGPAARPATRPREPPGRAGL